MAQGPKIAEAHVDISADLTQLREDVKQINAELQKIKPAGIGKIAAGAALAGGALMLLKGIFGIITGAIRMFVKLVKTVLVTAFKILAAIVKGVFKAITAVVKGVIALIKKTVTFIQSSIRVSADFGQSMARVAALTGTKGTEAFEGLRKTALQLGRTTEFTATQAADAMGNFAMAGFKTDQILQAIGPTLDFASANMLDLGTASDIAARVMGAMQLSASETRRVMDALTVGATKTNQNVIDLGEAFKNAGSAAGSANASFEMTTAALMAMADQGQRGSEAGSALKQVFLKLGTKNVSRLFNQLNIPLADATGNFRQLPDLIDDMNVAFQSTDEITKLTMLIEAFGTRAGPGMVKLLNAGGNALRDYLGLIKKNTGAAADIAAIQRDTVATSFKLVQSAVEGLRIAVGDVFGPFIMARNKRVAKFLEGVTKAVVSWTPVIQEKIKELFDWVRNESRQWITDLIAEFLIFKADFLATWGAIKQTLSSLFAGGGDFFKDVIGLDFMDGKNKMRDFGVFVISVLTEIEGVIDRIVILIASLFATVADNAAMIANFLGSVADVMNPFAGRHKKQRAQDNIENFIKNTLPNMGASFMQNVSGGFARLGQTNINPSTGRVDELPGQGPLGFTPGSILQRKTDRIAALDALRKEAMEASGVTQESADKDAADTVADWMNLFGQATALRAPQTLGELGDMFKGALGELKAGALGMTDQFLGEGKTEELGKAIAKGVQEIMFGPSIEDRIEEARARLEKRKEQQTGLPMPTMGSIATVFGAMKMGVTPEQRLLQTIATAATATAENTKKTEKNTAEVKNQTVGGHTHNYLT
tara:strand:- start:13702 stop:16167 length:2466 start_codon:yes stop_codon:yes gene_type:complete